MKHEPTFLQFTTAPLPQDVPLREGLSKFGPAEDIVQDLGDKSYNAAMHAVHVWGYSVTMRNSGT